MLAANVQNVELAPSRIKGNKQKFRDVRLPRGGSFPEDLKNVEKEVPTPYDIVFQLHILTTNNDHKWQIMEQIMLIFDPIFQIQTDDNPENLGRMSMIELTDISNEQQTTGNDAQIYRNTMTFRAKTWISYPTNVRDNIVNSIHLKMKVLNASDDIIEALCDITENSDINERLIDINEMEDVPPK